MALEMKYFILKPKAKKPYDHFATASRKAMMTFAMYIKNYDPELAQSLVDWVKREEDKQARMETAHEQLG